MITLSVLGSGSKGNSYLLSTDTETLVLDAGIPIKKAKIALDFNINRIKGVIVTHSHIDHLRYAVDYEKIGIPVWKPYENPETKKSRKLFGSFDVTCFDLQHDGFENRGYLIRVEGQTILYVTDFEYISYVFAPEIEINHMIIEANYAKEFLDDDYEARDHVLKGHAELQTTLEFIRKNRTDNLLSVLLCHLSDFNSDEAYFINEAKKVAICPVECATEGMQIILSETPF